MVRRHRRDHGKIKERRVREGARGPQDAPGPGPERLKIRHEGRLHASAAQIHRQGHPFARRKGRLDQREGAKLRAVGGIEKHRLRRPVIGKGGKPLRRPPAPRRPDRRGKGASPVQRRPAGRRLGIGSGAHHASPPTYFLGTRLSWMEVKIS